MPEVEGEPETGGIGDRARGSADGQPWASPPSWAGAATRGLPRPGPGTASTAIRRTGAREASPLPPRMAFPERGFPQFAATRVLLVGTGRLAVRVAEELARDAPGTLIAGALGTGQEQDLRATFPDVPVLGGLDRLQRVILEECIDEVHFALPLRSVDEVRPLVERARELGAPARVHVPGAGADVAVARLNDHPATTGARRLAKRVLDLTLAAAALVALAPLFGLIAAAVRLTSRGPAIFRQPRVGARRRRFDMLKFRTMVDNAEELRPSVQSLNDARGISFKVFRDPRVTRVGRILRRSSLDELPQLLNVVRGEMSLVGPRPIPVWVAEQLHEDAYVRRFSVPPGLTGLWQVEGREQDFDRMATLDLRYLDDWSLALDLKILLRTLPAVLGGEGAH